MQTDKTPLPLPTLADLEEEVRTLVASGTFRAKGKFKGNFGIFESPRTHAEAREIVAKEHGFKTWSTLHDYVVSDIAAVDTLVEMGDVVGLSCLITEDRSWLSRRALWRGRGRREVDLLTEVSCRGLVDFVDMLVDHGVESQIDLSAVFFWCLARRQVSIADRLFDRCDVEIHHLREHLYQLTEDLNVEGVAWLLERGADPDYRRAGIRWTPLHNALHTYPTRPRERQQICRLLIDAGADHDDNAVYDLLTGRVDNLAARLNTDPALVHAPFDLRGGRDIEIERRGDYGGAPISNTSLLHHCAEYGLCEEARLLLSRGANANIRAVPGEDGFDTHTPLFNTLTANANSGWDMLNLLLEAGGDVNVRAHVRIGQVSMRNITPLEFIARFPNAYHKSPHRQWDRRRSLDTDPHPDVVELLRSRGAS